LTTATCFGVSPASFLFDGQVVPPAAAQDFPGLRDAHLPEHRRRRRARVEQLE